MYLRSPQIWWAYLGIKSNPSIINLVNDCDHAVFFDNPSLLPPDHGAADNLTKYFLIFWEGVTDELPIEEMARFL